VLPVQQPKGFRGLVLMAPLIDCPVQANGLTRLPVVEVCAKLIDTTSANTSANSRFISSQLLPEVDDLDFLPRPLWLQHQSYRQ